MIKKPTGYDEAAAYTGEFQQLPKGKYVCVIKRVATQKSKNGNEQFVILYDIAEGDQKGFYQKMFDNDKSQNPSGAKWRGVFKQNMEGKGLSWFKGIITSIERSNNFTFQWDRDDNEKTLNGKKFGGIFRRRQYEAENGNRPIVTELWRSAVWQDFQRQRFRRTSFFRKDREPEASRHRQMRRRRLWWTAMVL